MLGEHDDDGLAETLRRLPEEQVRVILEHLSLTHPEIVSTAVVHVAQLQRQEPQDDLCSVETKRISNISSLKVAPVNDDNDDPHNIPPLLNRHTRSTSGGDKGLSEPPAPRNQPPLLFRREKRQDPSVGDLQPALSKISQDDNN